MPPLNRARWAVNLMFFAHGTVFANWASRIPRIQAGLNLSEAALGFTLLGLSLGVITALPLAGWLIGQLSSRRVTVIAALLQALTLLGLALAPTQLALTAALFAFGAAASIMDIGMNAQAVAVEQNMGTPIMSSFHALFSIGGFVGAGMGAAFAGFGFEPLPHFAIAVVLLASLVLIGAGGLIAIPDEAEQAAGPIFTLPPRAVLPLGIVAFCSTLGEGTMADWSAIYLRDIAGAGPAAAALGFSAFNLTMTAGRLTGDKLTARFGGPRMVRVGGGVAALGLLIAILVPLTPVVIAAFGLVGIGLATVIPLAFSAAGRVPGISPGRGIAGVATVGYAGFLAGPPVIGLIAEGIGLQASMGLVALLVGLLVVLGGVVTPR